MGPNFLTIDSELLNVLTRLMTPFRRYFQHSLDVNRFLVDREYANDIVERLSGADDPRILGAAKFLRGRLSGDGAAPPSFASVANVTSGPDAKARPTPLLNAEEARKSIPSQGEQGEKYIKRLR